MDLDIDFVRAQFPAFADPALQGQAFFENAGGSYACGQVINRLSDFYTRRKVQPYGPFVASQEAGAEMDTARARLSAVLGVKSHELSFGPSTTQNTYVLAQAFRGFLKQGEAIVVTNQDHEANSGPWRRLAQEGVEIREWRMDPETGHLDPAALADLLDEKVRLVCFPHCSNVVGEINPVTEITALAHAAGAFVCVDGVSYAPHGLPNLGEIGPDIYLFSSYKTYGPHQGVMVVQEALAQLLPNQGHYFNADTLYKRFTPAGPDHAQIAALNGIVDYFETLAAQHGETDSALASDLSLNLASVGHWVHGAMRARETQLLAPLMEQLLARKGLRLLGPRGVDRAPTLALDLGRPALPVAAALAEQGIQCGGGDFYAVRALEALGVRTDHGVLRLSFTHYTSSEEVTSLIEALDRVL